MKPLLIIVLSFFCAFLSAQETVEITETLVLIPLNEHTYIHSSTMTQEPYGTFTCNGLLYIKENEALIADTPADLEASEQLLAWLEQQGIRTVAVLISHHHSDCLAGLPAFHSRSIPSFSHLLTPELALADSLTPPQHTFADSMVFTLGKATIIAAFLGEAHARDNMVVYLPEEGVLFGGCMVKSLGSGKGYLGAANLGQWSHTVAKVKKRFKPRTVIPGHGKHGDDRLLDYTIDMFAEYKE